VVHPQTLATSGAAARSPVASINTGTAFLVGQVTSGASSTPQLVNSPGQFKTLFGVRDTDKPALFDAVYDAFRAGLSRAYVVGVDDITASGALQAGLDAFGGNLDCGQVYVPDALSTADQVAVIAHAAANNRTAILQIADGTQTAVSTAADAIRSATINDDVAGAFGSWITVPGYVAGTTRTSPLAAFALGLIARTDGYYGNPGHAAAGLQQFQAGTIRDALGLTRTFTGGEWDTLHDTSRVNIAAQQTDGTYELYDFVSLSTDPAWEQLNYQRLRMGIVSNARALMRPFNFRSLGEPHIFDKVNDVITSYMQSLYDGGALFGGTPADAYTVDTTYGPGQVNTPDTVAAEKMRAAIRYVPAPHIGEIELVVTSEGIVA
jgi:phage tail sheath protein FI